MALNQEIKNLIDAICYEYRLSQSEVAQKANVNPTYLSQVINGTRSFTDKMKDKILSAFPDFNTSNIQTVEYSTVHGNVTQDNRKYYSDSPDVLKQQINQLEKVIQDKEEQVRTLTEQVRTLTSSLAKKDEIIEKLVEKLG